MVRVASVYVWQSQAYILTTAHSHSPSSLHTTCQALPPINLGCEETALINSLVDFN